MIFFPPLCYLLRLFEMRDLIIALLVFYAATSTASQHETGRPGNSNILRHTSHGQQSGNSRSDLKTTFQQLSHMPPNIQHQVIDKVEEHRRHDAFKQTVDETWQNHGSTHMNDFGGSKKGLEDRLKDKLNDLNAFNTVPKPSTMRKEVINYDRHVQPGDRKIKAGQPLPKYSFEPWPALDRDESTARPVGVKAVNDYLQKAFPRQRNEAVKYVANKTEKKQMKALTRSKKN